MQKKRRKMDRTYLNYSSQLDRLEKDSVDLKDFISRVEKEGNQVLANKLKQKYDYLNSRISEFNSKPLAA